MLASGPTAKHNQGAPRDSNSEEDSLMHVVCDRPAALVGVAMFLAALAGMASAAWAGEAAVKEGDPAPEVKLPAALPGGKAGTVDLKDYKGKKHVVLYFFPKALTGG